MPGVAILMIVVFVIVLIIGGIYSYRKQEARRQALSALATKHGWRFDPSKDYAHDELFPQFSSFTTGDARYAYNRIFGSVTINNDDWPFQLGDYHYEETSGSGKNRSTTTYRFSYLLLVLPFRSVPSMAIRKENFFDRIAAFAGFDDIDFESAEFSKRFHVKGSDKRFVYDVIHPRMMQFLLDSDPPSIDIESGVCCLTKDRRCWSPEEFEAQIAWGKDFFTRWPKHLVSTLQSQSL